MRPTQHEVVGLDIDLDSAAWWAAVRRHELLLPHCSSCESWSFPPMPTCPNCAAETVALRAASGRGQIYSWVTVHVAMTPAYSRDVPYMVLLVATDEGPRLLGRALEEFTPEPGLPVQADFYEVGDQTLVGFRPVTGEHR